MTSRVVFEDDEIQLVHRPGGSDFTLVTFAALTHRPDGTWIWAQEPIAKLDLEAIGFVAKRENWYPAASMQAAAETMRRLLKPRAIGYGFSMGGYAVLKYGRILGLTHGLAVSPQVSIDPAEVPQDRRFHKFHDATLHAGMRIAPGDSPPVSFVAADPYWMPDAAHLAWTTSEAGATPIRLPFLKHAVMTRFKSSSTLGRLCDLVLAGDGRAIRDVLRHQRGSSVEACLQLARSVEAHGHPTIASALFARATALGASEPRIRIARARGKRDRLFTLLRAKRQEEARVMAAETLHLLTPMPAEQRSCARLLLDSGMPDLALLGYERAVRVSPRNLEARLGLLDALREQDAAAPFHEAKAQALRVLAEDAAAVAAIAQVAPPTAA
ncbi:hypothetical protein AAFN86_15010 [Roseomonas sp. CAU 1739]|uniref:tetratricopeptide repeat protein n=1 Tax=Roseomonas sp. CAU 1739 TaxID=3140364 RepID=UPI00325BE982